MTNDEIVNGLYMILGIMGILLFCLIFIYIIIKVKNAKEINNNQQQERINIQNAEEQYKSKNDKKNSNYNMYTRKNIYDFMEFDDVQDNMIIQKNGKRYLMVIECKGTNYDLMSNLEKIAVEEGFIQFLNTLKEPIQIYVQSRTVNMVKSIENYKKRINEIDSQIRKMSMEYNLIKRNNQREEKDLKDYEYEIFKKKNLYEYGKSVVDSIEKMNLNRNILNRKYYIIISYYSSDDEQLSKEEIRNVAFSTLYTRAQSLIRAIMVTNVSGRVLNSLELIDLLYNSYNRDEAEVYDIEKALGYGILDRYITSQDVSDKKMKALDQEIDKKSMEMAENAYKDAVSEKQKAAMKKEVDLDKLIEEAAKLIIDNSVEDIGKEMAELSKKNITKKRGGKNSEKEKANRDE